MRRTGAADRVRQPQRHKHIYSPGRARCPRFRRAQSRTTESWRYAALVQRASVRPFMWRSPGPDDRPTSRLALTCRIC